MKKYQVVLSPAFQRDLHKFPKDVSKRILQGMDILKTDPFPKGDKIKKLRTMEDGYRLRVGDYRIVYRVEKVEVIALRVVDRKEFEKIMRELA